MVLQFVVALATISSVPTTPVPTPHGDVSQFSGSELKGGGGNDTVFVTVSAASATDFKLLVTQALTVFPSLQPMRPTLVSSLVVLVTTVSRFVAVSAINTTVNGGDGDDSVNIVDDPD